MNIDLLLMRYEIRQEGNINNDFSRVIIIGERTTRASKEENKGIKP